MEILHCLSVSVKDLGSVTLNTFATAFKDWLKRLLRFLSKKNFFYSLLFFYQVRPNIKTETLVPTGTKGVESFDVVNITVYYNYCNIPAELDIYKDTDYTKISIQ